MLARVFAILHSQQQSTHNPFGHNFNKLTKITTVSSEQWNWDCFLLPGFLHSVGLGSNPGSAT